MPALWHIAAQVEGAEAASAVAEILDALTGGVSAFETREAGAEPAEWLVEAYAPAALLDAALGVRLDLAAASCGGEILALSEEQIAERDWLAENRRAFPPQRIGRFLIHGSHWREKPPPGAIAVEIDAATAFGTGEHPSTRGCLVAFDRLARRRRFQRPRDIGTGSGILAIAAAKLLRRAVAASDLDPGAVRVARHHAWRNGVSRYVHVACVPGVGRSCGHDLVFANILARPLMLMARDLAHSVAPGGTAILSGLLRRQEPGVLAAYRVHGLALEARVEIGGWSTLVLGKRNGPPP
ncbi:MAG TPA: 50S ribosomal protein L11 methyltransferase [Stellaceae bacterium]|nr:50S ribosomal protein L11 methyltransferase [Stellaceae bacterium]